MLSTASDDSDRAMRKKRHTPEEIAGKLRQADDMIAHGKLHGDVARTLGVSIMTYHRWRKARTDQPQRPATVSERAAPAHSAGRDEDARIADLQLENSRLRRLVTDLLLEKVRLEEALQDGDSDRPSPRKAAK
jgi:putative transposase